MKKQTLVLDTNAFITGQNLLKLGSQYILCTTDSVLDEIRDVKTKKLIEELPYKLKIIKGSKKNVDIVKQFAKKTGDIGSLSDVDIEVIAVAYQLYVEEGMQDKMRSDRPLTIEEYKKRNQEEDIEDEDQSEYSEDQNEEEGGVEKQINTVQGNNQEIIEENAQNKQQNPIKQQKNEDDDEEWVVVPKAKKVRKVSSQQSMDEEQGWVTPSNYDVKMTEINTTIQKPAQNPQEQDIKEAQHLQMPISVMTADYPMQNVCTQMCIPLLSLDGRRIKQIRRFILQCYLCWKQYKIQDNKIRLCKQCGYNSLSKIAYSINSKGEMILHRKKGWTPNQKVLEWKQKKYEEQQNKKKHKHPRRKKQASIFDNA